MSQCPGGTAGQFGAPFWKEFVLTFLTGFFLFWAAVLLRSNHTRPGAAAAPASTVYGVF